jgi:SAM-dependent methyltransferase
VGVTDRQPPVDLFDDDQLAASAVVANCAMNRERQLNGVNSYTRELGFNPVDVLTAVPAGSRAAGTVAWLDLCCGTGRALIQAADQMAQAGQAQGAELIGVDLVDAFDPAPAIPGLQLVCASVTAWTPPRSFDLITCVHGLHYLGDKLTVLTHAAGWLTTTGRLVADLDLTSIRLPDGRPAGRRLATRLRAAGLPHPGKHHIVVVGRTTRNGDTCTRLAAGEESPRVIGAYGRRDCSPQRRAWPGEKRRAT